MKTPIVYVLISSEQDYFLEEFWVSLFSLRQFHPKDKVIVVTDEPTSHRIDDRPELKEMISEVIIVPLPDEYNGRLRSRTLKTTVRNIIDGDFLTIDTDTVICKPLDEVDPYLLRTSVWFQRCMDHSRTISHRDLLRAR